MGNPKISLNICFLELSEEFPRDSKNEFELASLRFYCISQDVIFFSYQAACLLLICSQSVLLYVFFRYRKSSRRHRTTYMLLIVSFTYIATLLPSFVVQVVIDASIRSRGMEARDIFVALYPYTDVLAVVSLINYAANFFIYILSGHSFRFELRKIFVKERNTSFTGTRTREEFIRL